MRDLIDRIKAKTDMAELVEHVIKDPPRIADLVSIVETEKSTLKFDCEKLLRLVSEKRPDLVYPYFDSFDRLLDSQNNFLKWGAIRTIANLAIVDAEDKFERIFKRYYAPILGPVMITAASIVGSSWKIAMSKPELADRIADEILRVEKAKYVNKGKPSPECKNVVYGHAIDSFERFIHLVKNKEKVIRFVRRQLKNRRAAVKKRAARFVKMTNEEK